MQITRKSTVKLGMNTRGAPPSCCVDLLLYVTVTRVSTGLQGPLCLAGWCAPTPRSLMRHPAQYLYHMQI